VRWKVVSPVVAMDMFALMRVLDINVDVLRVTVETLYTTWVPPVQKINAQK